MKPKWKIKAKGSQFQLLAPACRSVSPVVHAFRLLMDADHPAECLGLYESIPAACRAIQREESWQAYKRQQREKTANLASASHVSPRTVMEPPC